MKRSTQESRLIGAILRDSDGNTKQIEVSAAFERRVLWCRREIEEGLLTDGELRAKHGRFVFERACEISGVVRK